MGRPKGSRNGVRNYNYYNCINCGKEFKRLPSYPPSMAKFCSRSCCSSNTGKNLPKEQFKRMGDIMALRTKGKTIKEIYKDEPEKYKRVRDALNRIKKRQTKKVDIRKMVLLYNKGMPMNKIAEKLQVGEAVIRRRLMDLDYDTNPRKFRTKGTFRKNHNYHGHRDRVMRDLNNPVKSKERARKISIKHKENWKNKEYIERWVKTHSIKPTKIEIKLNAFLQNNFPNKWKYVGDFALWIARKNPDFISVDNSKRIIELFGNYWHRNDCPEDWINHYKKHGFDCIVIWEHELKDMEKVYKRIVEFKSSFGDQFVVSSVTDCINMDINQLELDFQKGVTA